MSNSTSPNTKMASSDGPPAFAFVPRFVKKKSTARPTNAIASAPNLVSVHAPSTSTVAGAQVARRDGVDGYTENNKGKGKEKEQTLKTNNASPEDLAALVCLALSDYALWSDTDLRRKMDLGDAQAMSDVIEEDEPVSKGDETGYVSLAYLLAHSLVFRFPDPSSSSSSSYSGYPQTIFVKAIRSHASDFLDVRLIVPSAQLNSNVWPRPHGQIGYEVRRKKNTVHIPTSSDIRGKNDWDDLTIYVENIPIQYRSITGIVRFIQTLLGSTFPSIIQHVNFPPHHQDQPGLVVACKGFALITLSSSDNVEALLKRWPWIQPEDRNTKEDSLDLDENDNPARFTTIWDARKFGFRTLSKKRWEDLRAEYLLYRQQLVDEVNEAQDKEAETRRQASYTTSVQTEEVKLSVSRKRPRAVETPTKDDEIAIYPDSPYPIGCLVFGRNLHPETNKTTLRSLFSHFANGGGKNVSAGDGVDYLDYMKGTDVCHLRLSTPSQAQRLIDHFNSNQIVQNSGLDGTGVPLSEAPNASKPISVSLVRGKPEDVYWEKVPEKIRRQAVMKALSLMGGGQDGGHETTWPGMGCVR